MRPGTVTKALVEIIAGREGEFVVGINWHGDLTSLTFDFLEGVRDDHLLLNRGLATVIVDNTLRGLWVPQSCPISGSLNLWTENVKKLFKSLSRDGSDTSPPNLSKALFQWNPNSRNPL